MKRIISLTLILLVILGSVSTGLVYAVDDVKAIVKNSVSSIGSEENPYIISDFKSFSEYLLSNNQYDDTTYFKLTSDINAEGETVNGGYTLKNASVDGAGHTVSGLKLENISLFSSISSSQIRLLNFLDGEIIFTDEKAVNCSYFAEKTDKSTFITSCRFSDIAVKIRTANISTKTKVATVVAQNAGYIVNCVVSNCSLTVNSGSTVGAVTAANISTGYVINSVSYPNYIKDENASAYTLGAVVGKNEGTVKICYSESTFSDKSGGVISPIGKSTNDKCSYIYYLKNEQITDYSSDSNKTDFSSYISKLGSFAGFLSDKTFSAFNSGLTSKYSTKDYGCLWTVNNGKLDLSFDGRTGYVIMEISSDLSDATLQFSSGADVTKVSSTDHDEYIVPVGKYTDGVYKRTDVTVKYTIPKIGEMVNHFVLTARYTCSYNLTDVFSSDGGNYSTQFISATHDQKVNTGNFYIFPYPLKLSLNSTGNDSEIVNYKFNGSGTKEDPFKIRNAYELQCLSVLVNSGAEYSNGDLTSKENSTLAYSKAYYQLTNNIDLSLAESYFTPIGMESTNDKYAFSGCFDGRGYTINNLSIKEKTAQSGLFGYVKGNEKSYATIKNINLLNVEIRSLTGTSVDNADQIKGAVIGQAQYTDISGCTVSGGSISGFSMIGGIVGYASNSNISNCGSSTNINTYSTNTWAGGIVGLAECCSINNCYAAGDYKTMNTVDLANTKIGGILGHNNQVTVENCFYVNKSCLNSATNNLNGIEDVTDDYLKTDEFIRVLIEYSDRNGYSTHWMQRTKSYPYIAAAADAVYNIYTTESYNGNSLYGYLSITSVKANGKDIKSAVANTKISVTSSSTGIVVTDLYNNVLDVGLKGSGSSYTFSMPTQSVKIHPLDEGKITLDGYGTEDNPFLIHNLDEFILAIDYINSITSYYRSSYYKFCNDIDCGGVTLDSIAELYDFVGTFDGNGHIIANAKFQSSIILNMGGTLRNIKFKNIEKLSDDYETGFLFNKVNGASELYNVSVENCIVGEGYFIASENHNELIIYNCIFNGLSTKDDSNADINFLRNSSNGIVSASKIIAINFQNISRFNLINESNKYVVLINEFYYDNTVTIQYTNISKDCLSLYYRSTEYLSSLSFIYRFSQYEDKLFSNLHTISWGQNSESLSPDLTCFSTTKGVHKISYDFAFDKTLMFAMGTLPTYGVEGKLIELNYDPDYAPGSIVIKYGDRRVSYSTVNKGSDYSQINFDMPDEDIVISSDSVYPPIILLDGYGTKDNPYKISDVDDFLHFAGVINEDITVDFPDLTAGYVDYRDAYIELTADIELNFSDWVMIGDTESKCFRGNFNGNYYKIYGKLSFSTEDCGLFGYLKGCVKNLTLELELSSSSKIGEFATLTPYFYGSRLENIYSRCTLDISNYSGKVVGLAFIYNYNDIYVEKCVVQNTYIGTELSKDISFTGIVRLFCKTNREVFVNNCANISKMPEEFTYNNVISCGILMAESNYYSIYTTNCYMYAPTGDFTYAIMNFHNGSSENNYYYTKSHDFPNLSTYMTKEEFKSGKVAYLLNKGETNGSQAWYQNLDNGFGEDMYPLLTNNGKNTVYEVNRKDRDYSNFDKNEDGVYVISNPQELITFSNIVNSGSLDAKAIVVADIDMTGYNDFVPIGQTGLYYSADPKDGESGGYCGEFDGQGHIISNLRISGSSKSDLSYGLFGTVSGTVKNIAVEYFTYKGAGKDSRVGGIAGQLILGGSLTDCYTKTANINTQISTTNGVVGGIAGANYSGIIRNCYTYGLTVSSGRVGGIVGDNYGDANNTDGTDRPGKIVNCYTDYSSLCARGNTEASKCNISERIFKSGEITYLLGGENDDLWMHGEDSLPSFNGNPIFKNLCEGDVFYSIVDGDFDEHDIDCLRCKKCNNFDAATLVTADNYSDLKLDESYIGMYAVSSASNMYWFSERDAFEDLTGGIVMMNNIIINSDQEAWTPIDVDGNFTFDGRGHTLKLKLNFGDESHTSNISLFGIYNYATVKDLIIKGNVSGNTTASMGGFAASAYRTLFTKVISYANVTNKCQTSGNAGGLVGYYGGKHNEGLKTLIDNCAVYADVSGYNAGGLVGCGWNGTQYYDISNSAYVGDVTGINAAGAIVGYQATDSNTSRFTNIYWNEKDSLAFYGKRDTERQVYTKTSEMSLEAFASGEVAYLLNNGVSDGTQAWYQNIDVEPLDNYPNFSSNTVYRNTLCDGTFVSYSNTYVPFEHNYNDFHVCKRCIGLRPGEIAGIYGFNAELGGNISLNYYMVLDDSVLQDVNAKMVFTVPDTGSSYTVEIPVKDAEVIGQFYVFTCEVAAKEITSDIACQIIIDGDESDTFHYSVKKYTEQILSNPDVYENAIPLVKSMLNYGAYAQIYFNYQTDDLANTSEYITEDEKLVDDVDLSIYAYKLEGEQKDVMYDSSSLLLKSETAIKHYFTFKNPEDIENLTITVDGEPVIPTENLDYYNIKVSDIPAHKLQNMFVVQVGDLYLSYGVFSYGHIALNYSDNEALKNTIRALYAYNQQAIKYQKLINNN